MDCLKGSFWIMPRISTIRWWKGCVPNSKFNTIIWRLITQRWMELLKRAIKISKRSLRKPLILTRIGRRSCHFHCMLIALRCEHLLELLHFHWSMVWSSPTNKGRDIVLESVDVNQIGKGQMGSGQVWAVEFDWKKAIVSFVPWLTISKKHDASP